MLVQTEPMETIHLYVVREDEKKPKSPIAAIILSVLALLGLLATGFLNPSHLPSVERMIRVPAILLPLKSFTTSVPLLPTGVKTSPATSAHGTLALTNGSVVTEQLPQGIIFRGRDGIEVVTDEAVIVPAGSAAGFGGATVSAHTLQSGTKGNIAALDINQVSGTSLYIRNLQQFTGGKEAYSKTVVTPQDKQRAIERGRHVLIQQTLSGLLASPCKEVVNLEESVGKVVVKWTCQFVTYEIPRLPQVKVIHATIAGKEVVLDIVYVAQHHVLTTK